MKNRTAITSTPKTRPMRIFKDNGDGTYTFTQPKGKVSIEATFQVLQPSNDWANCPKDENWPIHAYTDTCTTTWYHDGVHYCLQNGLMGG